MFCLYFKSSEIFLFLLCRAFIINLCGYHERQPNSIKEIGPSAFRDCPNLDTVIFNGTVDEWNACEKGIMIFLYSYCTVYCVDGTVSYT